MSIDPPMMMSLVARRLSDSSFGALYTLSAPVMVGAPVGCCLLNRAERSDWAEGTDRSLPTRKYSPFGLDRPRLVRLSTPWDPSCSYPCRVHPSPAAVRRVRAWVRGSLRREAGLDWDADPATEPADELVEAVRRHRVAELVGAHAADLGLSEEV